MRHEPPLEANNNSSSNENAEVVAIDAGRTPRFFMVASGPARLRVRPRPRLPRTGGSANPSGEYALIAAGLH